MKVVIEVWGRLFILLRCTYIKIISFMYVKNVSKIFEINKIIIEKFLRSYLLNIYGFTFV